MKRIVICSDGTWNRPEKNLNKDCPTNVLKFARSIHPIGDDGVPQQVFYDWGVGSYYDNFGGGITGLGVMKNIEDAYRYIIQNYTEGDKLYFFGFSRGAYTVRSLCGLIYNCGILKRNNAHRVEEAMTIYRAKGNDNKPGGSTAVAFRKSHCFESRDVFFVGVWDTVGALGIPISFLGLFEDRDEFYDTKLGSNVSVARHALAIDERREDFEPAIWEPRQGLDLKQTWFCGYHSDVGGGHMPCSNDLSASLIPMEWMANEARKAGLNLESHCFQSCTDSYLAKLHPSKRHFYRIRGEHIRDIDHCGRVIKFHTLGV
ncbi:DUF2235 domain-containing protein [Salinimonas sediminis]|uniref:DUF2235 domain-containing protein n=1 Tax=Salinimonas sediminis TaxID=2303538 RepID=A0A346NMC6_9ALTE|nr:DUF2235 domain-containing protein [Salinimonas sediminis]AXR06683.1 DUF2235 domain-containing protein [Salinimonas sediminis]